MRKTIGSVLCGCVVALSLTACAIQVEPVNQTPAVTAEAGTIDSAVTETETIPTVEVEPETEQENPAIYAFGYMYEPEVVLYDAGSGQTKSIDLAKDFALDEKLCTQLELVGCCGKKLIKAGTYYDNGESTLTICSIDYESGDVQILMELEDSLAGVDLYQDSVYVTHYTREDSTYTYTETRFDLSEDGSYFVEADTSAANTTGEIPYYAYFDSVSQMTYNAKYSLSRAWDELGFIVLGSPDGPVVYTMDGQMQSIPLSDVSVLGYTKDAIIYRPYYEYNNVYAYSLSLQQENLLATDVAEVIMVDADKVYYIVKEGAIAPSATTQLMAVETASNTYYTVGYSEMAPGLTGYYVCQYGTQKVGDGIAYLAVANDKLVWRVTSRYNEAEYAYDDVADAGLENPLRQYGTLWVEEMENICPYCGKNCGYYYSEWMRFSDTCENARLASVANTINETIESIAYERSCGVVEGLAPYDDSSCEYHDDYMGQITEEWNTGDVRIIGDYVEVDMGGYWYGGGAHGYPYMSTLLFNLNTGELTSLRDLYPGTDDDFKTLVARRSAESLDERDYNPFFMETYEDIYAAAYESADISMNVTYDENGITLYYMPYDMGPYASGFIDVFVSYDELGFTLGS